MPCEHSPQANRTWPFKSSIALKPEIVMDQFQQKPKDAAAEQIECLIIANGLKPHDKLPGERELCDIYGFNRMTLRSAIQKLIVQGLIYNKPGVGTFVAEPKLSRSFSDLKSMTEFAGENGLALTTAVISFDETESNKDISKRLKVMLGSKVYVLTRLRTIDNVPLSIETVYISADRFPGLMEYDFSSTSLYKVLEEDYHIRIDCGEELISVTYLNGFEAKLLKKPENTHAFFIRSTTWDDGGNTVEHIKSVTRADHFHYTNVLNYSAMK